MCASSSIELPANRFDLGAETAFELFVRGTQRQIGPGADQIDDRFGLGQIHLPVEEGALGEFPRPRRRAPRLEDRLREHAP